MPRELPPPAPATSYSRQARVEVLASTLAAGVALWHPSDVVKLPVEDDGLGNARPGEHRRRNAAADGG
jgi:hypothetical protein